MGKEPKRAIGGESQDTSLMGGGVSPKKTHRAGGIGEAGSFMGFGGIPGQGPDEVLMVIHPESEDYKVNRLLGKKGALLTLLIIWV